MCFAAPGSDECEAAWSEFRDHVQRRTSQPPYHIKLLLDRLESSRGNRDRADIVILDHGCGGGLTLFYLAILGYTNFWGLDVGGEFASRNAVAAENFGHDEDRLSVYDGKTIPLPDASVDVVFSQQVIEHVTDDALEAYYREEGRVLKPGGLAVHYVPHRLVPFDSHTGTWLIHYLPRPLYHRLAEWLGSPVPHHLHLRWPWVHRSLLQRHVGPVEDVTGSRFSIPPDEDNYDGPLRLRHLVSGLMNAPVVGRAAESVLTSLVMLETLTIRR